MAIFQPIELSWHGKVFTIPAASVLGAIAEVEEVVTLPELFDMVGGGRPKISKLSKAYGALLRYAGAAIDDETVYHGMFKIGSTHQEVAQAIGLLIKIMMPPSDIAKNAGAASEGNLPRAKTARSRLSKRGSRRPLAAAG